MITFTIEIMEDVERGYYCNVGFDDGHIQFWVDTKGPFLIPGSAWEKAQELQQELWKQRPRMRKRYKGPLLCPDCKTLLSLGDGDELPPLYCEDCGRGGDTIEQVQAEGGPSE